MVFDLVAGERQSLDAATVLTSPPRPAKVLVFDSGLGGLTVYPHVRRALPGADFVYAADDAVFPYGGLAEVALVGRVVAVMAALIEAHAPDTVVIACHTASTLVLGPLRSRWPDIAFVGTVPAIKPAAAISTSRMISVLATPGTVAREYTRDLVRTFASDCTVTLVGAPRLASLAEALMRGGVLDRAAVAAEVLLAFVAEGERRTDAIVLACTHYPLLLTELQAIAPWPVTWIDPAGAIARRVGQVLQGRLLSPIAPGRDPAGLAPALFTSNREPGAALRAFLAATGLHWEPSRALAALEHGMAGR